MERYLCIHGHFYQPPRENPWLEAIELQDSAAPYHDWNERVTAECYAPNATARILDGEGRIEKIVNNYSKISFNFGPTLLSWMKEKTPEIHEAIVAADQASRERFSGHGSALAQVFNHMILPLANRRDKHTQVLWGIRDFEHRFGRFPEGMWLPETAADLETLETLAELGIQFTLLSPYQASRAREIGARHWKDVNGARIDPTRAYQVKLPSGRKIAAFFYDAPVSQAVAFERLLMSGEKFAQRLMTAFSDKRSWNQLVHIATDGESYGHHHPHGEMALAYALHLIEENQWARLTNYGEFLERHPPAHEVEIHEKSAWSCPHGIQRWMSHCGCNSGGRPGWNQHWRAPLRQAMDNLRDDLQPYFERTGSKYFKNPWQARNDYIRVILDRSPASMAKYFQQHGLRAFGEAEQVTALKLLEIQRHAMLMFTSCGWFFDELSGIETVQIIHYASRAMQLAQEVFGKDFEPGFLNTLEQGRSNIPDHQDGRRIYEKFVKPARVDWEKVVAHYAISSIFEAYPESTKVYLYTFEQQHRQVHEAGRLKLAIGRARVTFDITREPAVLSYGVLHLGDHNLNGGVRMFQGAEAYDILNRELLEAFARADIAQVIRVMDRHFGESNYSLKSLFRDQQRKILTQILASTREDLEGRYRLITERYTPLMRFLEDLHAPLPTALQTAADFILNIDLLRQFEQENTDLDRARALLEEGQRRRVALFKESLGFAAKNKLEGLMHRFKSDPGNLPALQALEGIAGLLPSIPFEINLWKTQNTYYEMLNAVLPEMRDRAHQADSGAQTWIQHFQSLGQKLGFRVPPSTQ